MKKAPTTRHGAGRWGRLLYCCLISGIIILASESDSSPLERYPTLNAVHSDRKMQHTPCRVHIYTVGKPDVFRIHIGTLYEHSQEYGMIPQHS